jgi:integrase
VRRLDPVRVPGKWGLDAQVGVGAPIKPRPAALSRYRSMRTRCGWCRSNSGSTWHVFSYKGKPIIQVSTKAWYAALERADIRDFRWHDLRHTWASWHVQQGTPLFALQELGGWESAEMVRRYAHLAADHLAPYAERLCALRVVNSDVQVTN